MRLALTIARKGSEWTLIEPPSRDITGQRARFKKFTAESGYDQVEVWTSAGRVKHANLAKVAAKAETQAAEVAVEQPEKPSVKKAKKKKEATA